MNGEGGDVLRCMVHSVVTSSLSTSTKNSLVVWNAQLSPEFPNRLNDRSFPVRIISSSFAGGSERGHSPVREARLDYGLDVCGLQTAGVLGTPEKPSIYSNPVYRAVTAFLVDGDDLNEGEYTFTCCYQFPRIGRRGRDAGFRRMIGESPVLPPRTGKASLA